ncbi:hypothetical protein ACLKA6_007826 [Drosophila palustris]
MAELIAIKSIETLRAETPEEFYALREAAKLDDHDDNQLNAAHERTTPTTTTSGTESTVDNTELQLKKLKFRREVEADDVGCGYCSCDEQRMVDSSSPTSTTTSTATMSPTLTTGSANVKSGSGIVKMATLKQRNAVGGRIKQQHHVRFSDEKNFSD